MAASLPNEDTRAIADALVENKQHDLQAAKRPDIGHSTLYVGTGAVAGLASGIAVVTSSAMTLFNRIVSKNPDLRTRVKTMSEEIEVAGKPGSAYSQSKLEKSLESLGEDFIQAFEKESGSLEAGIVKHSGGWIAGLTAAGAGVGYALHKKKQNEKTAAVAGEVDKLKRIQGSWQEQVTTNVEKSPEEDKRTR